MLELNKIYNMDCLEGMKQIEDNSIDMILCDLPYSETGNSWDNIINLDKLFFEYKRIIKDDGAIILTGTLKFGFKLYSISPELYKYDWIWIKDNGTNAPNVNHQPFRVHEYIFVFSKGICTNGNKVMIKYNPQKTPGEPYCQKSGKSSTNWHGILKNIVTNNETGERHPLTVQYFCRDKDKSHPTQKPLKLFEYLIKTYSNERDLVLDNCMGSGTTAVACAKLNRNFIGFEISKEYCEIADKRLETYIAQTRLFKVE